MKKQTLYKRNKSGKVQIWEASLKENSITTNWGQMEGKVQSYTLNVQSSQRHSADQRAEIQFESIISEYKDKGYKSLEDLHHCIVNGFHSSKENLNNNQYGSLAEFLEATLPISNTDANGNLKPMKCTALQSNKSNEFLPNVVKKIQFPCYVQPKLDGVRCFILWDDNQQDWIALSSSGKSYNVCARHILDIIREKVSNTSIIFDGELYIHGVPLQEISGLARTQSPIKEQLQLEYHIFDSASPLDFTHRISQILGNINEDWSPLIKIVPILIANSIEDIKTFNVHLIEEGYEGTIIRNPQGAYEFGVRSSNIFKLKDFQDAEFEIVGHELGARGAADMVFVCKIEDKTFKAKPIGNFEQKEKWVSNISKIIGKLGTVRFLTLSNEGLPQGNPVLKAIRDYE